MNREVPRVPGGVEVVYGEDRWRLLRKKREKALQVLKTLGPLARDAVVHGSVARGDVRPESDIDVAIVRPQAPAIVEVYLESSGMRPVAKEIVQATPSNTPKVYLYLDYEKLTVVSYPLAPLKPREREFYTWGGEASLEDLKRGARKPGVDKRLILIVPTKRGHVEAPVQGNEGWVARLLGVSLETVAERVRVLTRRREHGHTGVFLKVELDPEEPVEEAVARLREENPVFRRALRGWA